MVTATRGAIELPTPARASVAAHLLAEHLPVDRGVLDAMQPDELVAVHLAEHKHRDVPADKRTPVHAGHLSHTHPNPKATARKKP